MRVSALVVLAVALVLIACAFFGTFFDGAKSGALFGVACLGVALLFVAVWVTYR